MKIDLLIDALGPKSGDNSKIRAEKAELLDELLSEKSRAQKECPLLENRSGGGFPHRDLVYESLLDDISNKYRTILINNGLIEREGCCMYYNVIIETLEKTKNNNFEHLYEMGIANKQELIDQFVYPYLNEEKIYI